MDERTLIVGVKPLRDALDRIKADIARGGAQHPRVSFATPVLLFQTLTEKRLGVLEAMQGAGPMALRELARRLERDVKGVHSDVHALLDAGLLVKQADGRIECPYDRIRLDVELARAA